MLPNYQEGYVSFITIDFVYHSSLISTQMTADALIAQKRAEIAAKLAAMKSAVPTPTLQTPATQSSDSPSPAPPPDDLARRVAEAQRRVAESQSRLAIKENPYMVSPMEYRWSVTLTRLRL